MENVHLSISIDFSFFFKLKLTRQLPSFGVKPLGRYLNLTTIVYALGLVVSVLLLRWGRAEEAVDEVDGWIFCLSRFLLGKKIKRNWWDIGF